MKYALFYSDTQEFIAAEDDRHIAVSLARELSARFNREIAVIFNDPHGDVDLCCKFQGAKTEIIGGRCLNPLHRWLVEAWRWVRRD